MLEVGREAARVGRREGLRARGRREAVELRRQVRELLLQLGQAFRDCRGGSIQRGGGRAEVPPPSASRYYT